MSENQGVDPAQGSPEPRVPLADHDEISRKILGQPWAVQVAIVTIAAHCTVIRDKCEENDIAAVSDLAGCISQDLLELADFYAAQPPAALVETDDDLLAELRRHERDYPSLIHGPLCGRAADEIVALRHDIERHIQIAADEAARTDLYANSRPLSAPNSSAETSGQEG